MDENTKIVRRDGIKRRLKIPDTLENGGLLDLRDSWCNPSDPEAIFNSSAFRSVVLRSRNLPQASSVPQIKARISALSVDIRSVPLRLTALRWRLEKGHSVVATGPSPVFGGGSLSHAPRLMTSNVAENEHSVELLLPTDEFPFKYRYKVDKRISKLY